MKRLLVVSLAVMPVALAGLVDVAEGQQAPANATASPSKLTICHKTGSVSNPWRRITISSHAATNPSSRSGEDRGGPPATYRRCGRHRHGAVPVGISDAAAHCHTAREDHDLPQDGVEQQPVPADHRVEPGLDEPELGFGADATRSYAAQRRHADRRCGGVSGRDREAESGRQADREPPACERRGRSLA